MTRRFPISSLNRVVGNGILHHLELPAAMTEVDKILKPEAKALFQEPLGGNPLLRLYRSVAGIHTLDERPLRREDLSYLSEQWSIKTKYSGLVTFPRLSIHVRCTATLPSQLAPSSGDPD